MVILQGVVVSVKKIIAFVKAEFFHCGSPLWFSFVLWYWRLCVLTAVTTPLCVLSWRDWLYVSNIGKWALKGLDCCWPRLQVALRLLLKLKCCKGRNWNFQNY